MPHKGNSKNFSEYHFMEKPPKKLLEQVSDVIRLKHYSCKTEKSYVNWIKHYIIFHGKRHPREMGEREIEEFLTHLAVDKNIAAYTQNQALNAIFLYKAVLKQELELQVDAVRAKRSKYLPTVLTKEDELRFHLQIVKRLHQQDLSKGYGSVHLPFALERKS